MTATRTTILLGVPTMCIALCRGGARSAEQLPPVRIAHVGGAAVPEEVARDFERTFGGDLYEGYGLTELSGIATTYSVGQPRKPGSVGTPLGGTEIRIARAGRARRRRGDVPRAVGDPRLLGRRRRDAPRRSTATAGSRPATSATSTTTATSSSSTARRS